MELTTLLTTTNMTLNNDQSNLDEFEELMNSNQYAAWYIFLKHANDPDDAEKWISVMNNFGITLKFNYETNKFYHYEINN